MAHAAILRCARHHNKGAADNAGFDYLFERVAPYIKAADIACFNAEFPAAKRLRLCRRMYRFNAPRSMVGALHTAGFDIANLANNHSYDQGISAVGETVEVFREAGIIPVGTGKNKREAYGTRVVKYREWRMAFIGASRILPEKVLNSPPEIPQAHYFVLDEIIRSIRKARSMADIVVVNVHWGTEYKSFPKNEDLISARKMMDAGADVIAGHHPHVLQRVIEHSSSDGRRCIAAMSLGNFISNQSPTYKYGKSSLRYGDTRDGAILRVTFEKDGRGVRLVGWDAVPLWTWIDRVERRACSSCTYDIQVWPIPDALERIRRELKSPGLTSERRKYLRRMHDDLLRRCRRTLDRLGAPEGTPPLLSSIHLSR